MRYTLWSTEGLLGETDLDFFWHEARLRAGFLDPTELGEILLGVPPGSPIGTPYPCDSLTMELRDEQGAVIPTEEIYVRDIDYVMSLFDAEHREPELSGDEAAHEQRDVQPELDFLADAPEVDDLLERAAEGAPGESTRFQIHVRLLDDASIP